MVFVSSKQREAKRQRRNQVIIGIILIFVMFGSVFGIIVGSFGEKTENNNLKYNGLEFINQNNIWFVEKGDFDFIFRNNPEQTEKLNIYVTNLSYLNSYSNQPLYLYSDYQEATSEIYSNLNQVVQRMQFACLINDSSECEAELPTKTCENNFILIKENEIGSIIQEGNCVFIQGPKENLTQITDEFLFRITGIKS